MNAIFAEFRARLNATEEYINNQINGKPQHLQQHITTHNHTTTQQTFQLTRINK